jgi:hypothetical protein
MSVRLEVRAQVFEFNPNPLPTFSGVSPGNAVRVTRLDFLNIHMKVISGDKLEFQRSHSRNYFYPLCGSLGRLGVGGAGVFGSMGPGDGTGPDGREVLSDGLRALQ